MSVWRARILGAALPAAMVGLSLLGWEAAVRIHETPHYILPAPSRIARQLWMDWGLLGASALATLRVTLLALAAAVGLGVFLATLFSLSRGVAQAVFPFAVILQVTPVVAIAPLILIYVDSPTLGLLICAWLVAFFPILSNTALGLRSADHNLQDLFSIYGASRWDRLRLLLLPSALPYFLGGLRIAGGLALIGAIVAEYVAGSVGATGGLAFRILEASYRLNIPRMFAALALIGAMGVAIFMATGLIQHLLLRRWHDSAAERRR